jgi:hypothetical protein
MTQIQSTMNYDLFQFLDGNRKINPNHVFMLKSDPTFAEQFEYHPIIVNEKMQVIDGQHRLEAARSLEIPVYYVVQKGASHSTVKNINVNQKAWRAEDYLTFYSFDNKEFAFVNEMKNLFVINLDFIIATIAAFENTSRSTIAAQFKRGAIKIKNKQQLKDYLQSLTPLLKDIRKDSNYEIQHLFGRRYAYEFAFLYKNNLEAFQKLLHHLPTYYKKLPYCSNQSDCRDKVVALSKFYTKKAEQI